MLLTHRNIGQSFCMGLYVSVRWRACLCGVWFPVSSLSPQTCMLHSIQDTKVPQGVSEREMKNGVK